MGYHEDFLKLHMSYKGLEPSTIRYGIIQNAVYKLIGYDFSHNGHHTLVIMY
jgi:hypothetical protein